MANTAVDVAIDKVAARQHGAFSRAQALRAGATRSLIQRRLAAGRWLAIDTAVYVLPGNPGTWLRQLKAAELSTARAVVSHRSAAALHGLDGFGRGRPEILVPHGINSRSKLATVHRSRLAFPTKQVQSVRVTTVARTFLDVGECCPTPKVHAALEDAAVQQRVDLDALAELLARAVHSHPHTLRRLRPVMDRLHHEEVPSESVLELRLHEVLEEAGVPGVVAQVRLPWWPQGAQRVDVAVPPLRTIIEADGRRWHTRVSDFDRDRWRDNQAALHHWRVLRFTWYGLTNQRRAAVADLRALARQLRRSA